MNWQPTESSVMTHVHHDGQTMHVRYKSGKEYAHAGVPKTVFNAFMVAPSKGKFLNQHIAKQYPGKPR